MSAKQQLTDQLRSQGAFRSYADNSLSEIPDKILIEEALRMGDVPELILLFKLYSNEYIKQTWQEKLLPDQRIYPHNYYLAKVFFNIKHPEHYIEHYQNQFSRYERIKNADA
ncbi:MAG: hypothetical protein ABEH43_06610 [Flavobacteriales bacterium]